MKIFNTLVLVLLIGCNQLAFASDALEDAHIIDWHVHIAGLGFGGSGNFVNEEMRRNYRFEFFLQWMGVTEKELEEHGDQILVKKINARITQSKYIDQAIVLAMDGVIDETSKTLDRNKTQIYISNEFVASQVAQYPNLLFGASINPNRINSVKLLEEVHRQGAVLIKWIPNIMYIDPSDERFIPFYKRMAELNIPLLTHTGVEKSFANANDDFADPRLLELPLKCGVTVIAAHIASAGESDGQDNFERILPMFDEFSNLYTDISSLTQLNRLGYLAKALKYPALTERMIYGSDWPLQSFPLVSTWYHVNQIGIKKAWRVSRYKNKWDRDIKLKEAVGVPQTVFVRKLGILDIFPE